MKRSSFFQAGQAGKRRQFSARAMVLTGLISIILGAVIMLAILVARVDRDGLSVLHAMNVISSRYVGEYEWDDVVDQTLDSMVTSLGDRWSYYLTKGEYQQVQEARQNAYTGIGVTISKEVGDEIIVLSVSAGSPAEEVGIQAGDAITAVDDVTVTADSWAQCVEMIRGKAGTSVSLTVRHQAGGIQTIEVDRREIVANPVEYEMLEGDIGLLRLRNFYATSGAALIAGVDALVQEGATAIIFDLRDNPGGYVTELTKMLDHLLPEGVIFQSCDTQGEETVYHSGEEMVDLPFAVLVNGESYSAAEFFAAQLRESADAIIIGELTSGKGFAQQLFLLPNGSAIGLSTSRYYTGGGVSLISTGVTPDETVILTEDARLLLLQENLSPEEDAQMQLAAALLRQAGR